MSDEREEVLDLETIDGKIAFLEAVLFVSKEPVEPGKIMSFLNIGDVRDFEKLMVEMDDRCRK